MGAPIKNSAIGATSKSKRRFALACAALLAPGLGHAACTGDIPATGGVLNVYFDATTTDGVIGGISANQCGLEVTDFCEAGRCLTFFDGLSGYIDVTGLESGTITPPPTVFEYDVSAVDGTLSFMGRTQPLEMNGTDTIRITPAADHVVLSLPDPLPQNIRMTSTGSSGWEAVLPDWVGVPVPVILYLDRLSAPQASLELLAEHQILRMDMRLTLTRVGEPANTMAQAPCDALADDLRPILNGPDSIEKSAVLSAMFALGVFSIDPTNPKHCAEMSAALRR